MALLLYTTFPVKKRETTDIADSTDENRRKLLTGLGFRVFIIAKGEIAVSGDICNDVPQ